MAEKEVLEMEVKSNIGEVATQTERLEGATKKGKAGFKGLGKTIKGVGMALKAAGIGLIVALLAKLMDVFRSNQKVLDTFNTAMTALSIAFNDFFNYLSDNVDNVSGYFTQMFEDPQESMKEFGDAFKKNIQERIDSYVDTLGLMAKAVKQIFAGDFNDAWETAKEAGKEYVDVLTGVDGSFEQLKENISAAGDVIVDYSKKTWGSAAAVTAANKAAELAAVTNAKLNAEYLKEAESLRQVRDNVNLTFAERIKANDDLNLVLEKQQKLQKEALQTEINALQLAYDINSNDANSLALKTKQVEMLQLEEAINGQLSEQKTNAVALENELRDAINATLLAGMSGREAELEQLRLDYEEKVRLAKQAGQDIFKINAKYAQDIAALDDKLAATKQKTLEMGAKAATAIAGEGSAVGKSVAVAMAIMNTKSAVTAALGAVPYGPWNIAQAIATGIFGMTQVQGILSTPTPGGGGGGSAGGVGAAPAAPAPQMMSGAFDLSGGVEPEPVQAYVLTDEMTNSQNQLANIRRRATI